MLFRANCLRSPSSLRVRAHKDPVSVVPKSPKRNSQLTRTLRLWKFALDCQWRFVIQPQTQTAKSQEPKDEPNNDAQKDKLLGEWLRNEMIELGPAFMKMGQFMSTRSDVFGAIITNELSYLQDSANPVDFAEIQPIIERELGFPLATAFTELEENPIASASIGQVHRAKMRVKGSTGATYDVVVKIQKPGVREQILEDLSILKGISKLAAKTGTQRGKEAQQLLSQYETFLQAELDYKNEVQNMMDFREAFATANAINADSATRVLIPRPFPTLCTENVLVMEQISSIKVTDVVSLRNAGVSPTDVASCIVNAFIAQIVTYGLVHCDPHPGNIGIVVRRQPSNDAVKMQPVGSVPFDIVLYDFGNVISLSEDFRSQINNLVVAIVQEDVDEFLELLIRLNVIMINDPLEKLELKSFFSYFFEYLKTVDFTKLRTSILDNEALQQSQIGFKVDNDFLALFRVFSLLDGTCVLLDPEFSYIDALGPFSQTVFQDTKFIESRIRRDIGVFASRFSGTGSSKSTEDTMMALNSRIRDLGDRTNVFRGMFVALAVMDGMEDPERFIVVLPVLAWLAFGEKK